MIITHTTAALLQTSRIGLCGGCPCVVRLKLQCMPIAGMSQMLHNLNILRTNLLCNDVRVIVCVMIKKDHFLNFVPILLLIAIKICGPICHFCRYQMRRSHLRALISVCVLWSAYVGILADISRIYYLGQRFTFTFSNTSWIKVSCHYN